MKRICLFAGFDFNNVIHDYVIYYITELSKLSDVYYLSDNCMTEKELAKLNGITKKSFSHKHGKYDFGSWQELINKIGWDEIEKYDQLILANDSCYGPLFDLQNTFDNCELKYDFWGLTESYQISYHIQSYFLVMSKNVIKNNSIREFIKHIKIENNVKNVIKNYEINFSKIIIENNLAIGSYIKNLSKKYNPCSFSGNLIKEYKLNLIKVKILMGKNLTNDSFEDLIFIIKNNTNYNINLIEKHILSKGISLDENCRNVLYKLRQTKLSRVLDYIPKWIFSVGITTKHKLLIKIFKIPVFNMKIFK